MTESFTTGRNYGPFHETAPAGFLSKKRGPGLVQTQMKVVLETKKPAGERAVLINDK
jgi:hypothetical protein